MTRAKGKCEHLGIKEDERAEVPGEQAHPRVGSDLRPESTHPS